MKFSKALNILNASFSDPATCLLGEKYSGARNRGETVYDSRSSRTWRNLEQKAGRLISELQDLVHKRDILARGY
jgi:hypothetical protein